MRLSGKRKRSAKKPDPFQWVNSLLPRTKYKQISITQFPATGGFIPSPTSIQEAIKEFPIPPELIPTEEEYLTQLDCMDAVLDQKIAIIKSGNYPYCVILGEGAAIALIKEARLRKYRLVRGEYLNGECGREVLDSVLTNDILIFGLVPIVAPDKPGNFVEVAFPQINIFGGYNARRVHC